MQAMISAEAASSAVEDVTKSFINAIEANVDETTARKIIGEAGSMILEGILALALAPVDDELFEIQREV